MSNNTNSNNSNNNNNNRLMQMISYVESIPPIEIENVNRGNNLIFGEEQPGYYAIPGEERNLEKTEFEYVKTLSDKITEQLYGEPKYGHELQATYGHIVKARKKEGKKGLRGMNMKGILCAMLIIILKANGIHIDINDLIKAANKVSSTTAKVTSKMVLKYVNLILDKLVPNNNNNNNSKILSVRKDLRRIGIKFGYSGRNLAALLKKSDTVNNTIYSYHTPHIISAALLLNHTHRNSQINNEIFKKLGVTKPTLLKALKRMYPGINWNSKFSTQRKSHRPLSSIPRV